MMAAIEDSSPPSVMLALRQMLPSDGQTLLLRAALDGSGEAWSTWRATHDLKETLANDHVGVKGLLPLLAYTLEQNSVALAPDDPALNDLSLLRMARYRESLRFERYQAILQQALTTLAEAGVQAILLKGGALALTVYPQPALRHCHDIDLLIQPSQLSLAAKALLTQRFDEAPERFPGDPAMQGDERRLHHTSGLPVELHTHLSRKRFFDIAPAAAWQNARPLGNATPALMLAPEWELVHIMGAMLCSPKRARVTWVCDAHFLMAANPRLDWALVCEIAIESALALPAFVLLGYLQEQHQAPIPAFVFAHLQQNFAQNGRAGYEQLLQCARVQKAAGYGELLATASTWQERALLWRWMLFPLPSSIQQQETKSWQLPYFYLRRGMRYLSRQVASTKPTKEQARSGQA